MYTHTCTYYDSYVCAYIYTYIHNYMIYITYIYLYRLLYTALSVVLTLPQAPFFLFGHSPGGQRQWKSWKSTVLVSISRFLETLGPSSHNDMLGTSEPRKKNKIPSGKLT